MILQRLAGHLHGHIAQAVVPGVGKVPLKLQGLRGGEVGLELLCAVIGVDGGDDARGGAALPRQILVQNILQVIGGGRFALGPGDANDVQITGGVAVEQVGQGGDGLPHVRHPDAGQIHLGVGLQAHIGHGPLVPGHLQKFRFEVGTLAHKQGAGDHLAGVVGNQSHRGRQVQAGGPGHQQPPLLQQIKIVPQGTDGLSHSCRLHEIKNKSPGEYFLLPRAFLLFS